MSKETFKLFARNHPELASRVINDNNISWQKLYELYEIYGEDQNIWNNYLNSQPKKADVENNQATFKDVLTMIRNIDLDSVQKGVNKIQKTIGLLQDIGIGSTNKNAIDSYEPRPMYQYFED